MRLRFWRKTTDGDGLDPELSAVFARGAHPPVIDPARLDRGRALVAARLRPQPASGGWFGRRLAYAAAGGGGLWASVLGAAAAHKGATAVGIGVLLAGGATAEISGVGPAVREAVSPAHSGERSVATATATANGTGTATANNEDETPGNGAVVTEAPEGVPGNLSAHVRNDGSFSLRGLLVAVDGEVIEVLTSVDDFPLEFELGDADVRIPGANAGGEATTLEDREGHLVRIAGVCDALEGQLTEDCELTSVQVLGNAGQNGDADDGAEADGAGESASNGNGNGNGPPENRGRPDNPGKPDDRPGHGPGGSGNSDDD